MMWNIVGYEIGSGYGPLNDAENVASRRRRQVALAKDKRFAYTLKITGLWHEPDSTVLSLSFFLSFLFAPSFSIVFPRFMLYKRSSESGVVRSLNHCW